MQAVASPFRFAILRIALIKPLRDLDRLAMFEESAANTITIGRHSLVKTTTLRLAVAVCGIVSFVSPALMLPRAHRRQTQAQAAQEELEGPR